jgi:hypothetical protein
MTKKKGTKWQIIVVYMWLQNHICGGAMGCYRKWPWPEVTSPKAALTWNDVSHVTGRCSDRNRKCSRAHAQQVHFVLLLLWLPEVTEGHVTANGFPWVCVWPPGSCAISALVGHFDRKWHYETLRSPEGGRSSVPMRNRKLRNICPSRVFSPEGVFSRTSASYK